MRTFVLAVTGLAIGITACSSGGTTVVEIQKTPVASVTVSLPSSSLLAGQTQRATAIARDATGVALSDRPIAWQSSSTSIASVDNSGMIAAIAPGSIMVKAASEGVSGEAAMTVVAPSPIPVASVSVLLSATSLAVGQTAQATATLKDANGNTLSGRTVGWQSSNVSVATIASNGGISAVGAGNATITASSEGQSGTANLAVTAAPPVPVASVTVSPATPSVQAGATVQLSAVTRDANGNVLTGRTITWSSSNTTVATVSGSGLVSGLVAGSATITATSGSASGTAALTVTAPAPVPVASVTVSPATPSVQAGATIQLSAVTRDANGNVLAGRTITWSSSNNTVATVSASGLVNGLVAGSATISATSGSASGTATVTVTGIPPVTSPEPGASDVILWQDNFNKATWAELVAAYDKRGVQQLITDGRSGNAIRFPYTASSGDNLIEMYFPATTDIYFRYWYRLSPGADPTCGGRNDSGFKWFMPWRRVNPRYTMGVSILGGGPAGYENTGLEFSSHDNTSSNEPNPFMQNINKSKTFRTTADGAWHEYTLHIVTGNGGYEQIWVDGLLVLDNSAYGYDHDPEGIYMVQFPGTMVTWYSGCEFTVDVDDLAIWHK